MGECKVPRLRFVVAETPHMMPDLYLLSTVHLFSYRPRAINAAPRPVLLSSLNGASIQGATATARERTVTNTLMESHWCR